ncbi:hypothetical protein C0J52_28126 [Blattella germanica]|nr:hypothetical protein C0J52_28126 [Blattella germanica]
MEEDSCCDRLIFSDESIFHVCGKVNKNNVRIWSTQHHNAYIEYQRDSPKVNVFCAISNRHVYRPFFFNNKTISVISYLDMVNE